MGGLDIRVPIGLMFLVKGILLAIYGLMDPEGSMRDGINLNVVWGGVLILFSVTMLFLGRKGFKMSAEE
jgi:hypothetical protein